MSDFRQEKITRQNDFKLFSNTPPSLVHDSQTEKELLKKIAGLLAMIQTMLSARTNSNQSDSNSILDKQAWIREMESFDHF